MFIRKVVAGLMMSAFAIGGSVAVAQDAPKEIRFASLQGSFVDGVNTMLIEQFEALHPDVTVKFEVLDGATLDVTLAAQAAAGSLADVIFTADLYVVPFAKGGISVDMEPLAAADPDFDISDVYENMLDLSKVEGKGLYMIPSSYDVVTMYYNKTLFEQAGAPLPTAESTWDDVIASCKTILEATGAYCFPAGTNGGTTKWWATYVPWIKGFGGDILSEDGTTVLLSSPESLAGLKAYTDIWTTHGVGQPFDFDAGGDCFMVGKCALQFTIPGPMASLRAIDPQPFEWDVEVIPSFADGTKITGMGTYGFSISANAKDPQLAWDFIKGLLSAETQKASTLAYNGMPLLKSLRNDPDILALAGPPDNIEAFMNNGANGITPTYFPGNCGSLYAGQINTEINDAFDAVIVGGSSVEDAFTTANDNIQSCLEG
ncbi:MAG: extracellular solute-binding protein [Chloroflexi bacterium]|nr:extracellular solute-binding protein [Chloroflexota bacterium]MCC6891688.1 extracellular solute-binding protein [Anaerolineae bacterium]